MDTLEFDEKTAQENNENSEREKELPKLKGIKKIYYKFILKESILNSLKSADKIIAVSRYTKESIIKTFGSFPIEVIYNGIDTNKFKPNSIDLICHVVSKKR